MDCCSQATGDQIDVEKKKVKKKVVKKAKGRPDEDLFGNTDDIFGDVPDQSTAAKPKKKKKKAEAISGDAAAGGATADVTTEVGGGGPISGPSEAGAQNPVQEATGEWPLYFCIHL